jgi:hypothetical protein
MLSMEPFPASDERAQQEAGMRIVRAVRGKRPPLAAFAGKTPQQALAEARLPVKELEWSAFLGEPSYVARMGVGNSRIIPVHGPVTTGLDWRALAELAKAAVAPATVADSQLLTAYDAYYLDRLHERPLPVLRVQLNDQGNTRLYLDPRTGQVVGSYSSHAWVNRWLYHGLHSINLPWLYQHRPAWDLVVLALLGGGTALSITSIWIAAQVLQRKLRAR